MTIAARKVTHEHETRHVRHMTDVQLARIGVVLVDKKAWILLEARAPPALDMPVVGFNAIIAVAACSLSTMPPHVSLGAEILQRRRIAAHTIPAKHPRRAIIRIGQGLR